jgi:inhibitor of cysteine peptidase
VKLRAFGAAVLGLMAAAAALAAARTVTLDQSFDGGVVHLAVGNTLAVRLPSNPSTGYAWSVVVNDPKVLRIEGAPAREPAAADLVGSGDFQLFEFKATRAGKSSLGLVSARTPDSAAAPDRFFRVAVVVDQVLPIERTVSLGEADDGSKQYVVQGDRIAVRLPSNVTTGYGWSVAQAAPGVLQPGVEPKTERPAGAAPGKGGFQTFEFPVVGTGQGWLQLVYRRPFEKDVAPAKSWSIFLAAAGVTGSPSP